MSPPPSTGSPRSSDSLATFRRSLLNDPPSPSSSLTLDISTASPTTASSSPILTVNLPRPSTFPHFGTRSPVTPSLMPSDHSLSNHLTPTISQQRRSVYQVPSTLPASGSNRLPVSRLRRPSASGSARERHASYSKPFPIPPYLLHSSYAKQFFTTPSAEPVFVPGSSAASNSTEIFGGKSDSGVSGDRTNGEDGDGERDFAVKSSEGLAAGDVGEIGSAVGNTTILLPTCWDELDRCVLIELSSDGLGSSFAGSGKYGDKDAAAVRANRPIPPQAAVYYFEVTIMDKGKQGFIGIGLSHRDVSLSRLPGWEANSWGYHGDDGFSFACQGTGKPFGPQFGTGDVIGCGIDYTGVAVTIAGSSQRNDQQRKDEKGKAKEGGKCFFTKNGTFLGYAFQGLPGKLYPSVGLRTPGEIVRANFGSEPFVFDIDGLVRDRQQSVLADVESTIIPPSLLLPPLSRPISSLLPPSTSERIDETLQSLILSYLVHHGYSTTAQSFSDQLSQEREERCIGLIPPSSKLEGDDVFMKRTDQSRTNSMLSGLDSVRRGEIKTAFLKGEAEKVIELTKKYYPAVMESQDEAGGIEFKLRMRVFVEAFRKAEFGNSAEANELRRKGDKPQDEDAHMDNIHDHFSTPPISPVLGCYTDENPPLQDPLDELLALGQALYRDYAGDERPAVQEALELTFSLMAYDRPEERGGKIAWLLSKEQREELSDELNSVILVSQSLPPLPQLESLWRHASASIRLLGDLGHGGAALLRPRR